MRLGPAQDVHSFTRALIWVHYKVVRYFSQLILSLFSHLNSERHNFVIELCLALEKIQFLTFLYYICAQYCTYWIIDCFQ